MDLQNVGLYDIRRVIVYGYEASDSLGSFVVIVAVP